MTKRLRSYDFSTEKTKNMLKNSTLVVEIFYKHPLFWVFKYISGGLRQGPESSNKKMEPVI